MTGEPEARLAGFVVGHPLAEVPPEAQRTVLHVLRAAASTGVAGAGEDGIAALREELLERGGAPQAATLVFGDRLPAAAAAQLNGTMCRALDFCDAMAPGPHIGSALLPAALAAAELAGGCSGAEFLAALAVGAELGARFNLGEAQYDGFDPTGVCVVFAATAAAARILKLDALQTRHALALAFNRCGGSFQSNVDGSLAVRLVQGWVAESGVLCAQLARRGLTGPAHFLTGVYGYAHLYGRDRLAPDDVAAGLGREWRLQRMMFKKYPSCGATQGMTELALQLRDELRLAPAQVESVTVRLNPYCHKLVGKPFAPGANPRVDAQFSAQYCVANALVRGTPALAHFTPQNVADATVRRMVQRVAVESVPALDARGHTAVDLLLRTADGAVHERALDVAPGYPGNELSDAQHRARFDACMAYARWPLPAARRAAFLDAVEHLAELDDARRLAHWLQHAPH